MSESRPNPDKLLEKIKEEERASARGALKIYLGMAAGVGKTFAMLSDAIQEKERGVDIIIGYIEPHGRKETEELTTELERLPVKKFSLAGSEFPEFDIDLALARKPDYILVDELAHTNAPGSRHPKRWQDVEELLDAGINVYSTVNIQHFESLKDVVAQITGVSVQETVPDLVLTDAHEVEVVDIPPGELIQRLKEGKIYSNERIPTALGNFFREGNLIALRELVLRRTAERVDAQMKKYRLRHSVDEIWPARDRIMVCIGPSPMAKRLVRAAHRLATSMHAELIALNLANPNFLFLPEEQKLLANQGLELAENLGARVIIRAGQDMVAEILDAAREENISSIVIGKSIRPRWRDLLSRSLVDELLRRSSGISIHVISSNIYDQPSSLRIRQSSKNGFLPSLATLLVVAFMTGICLLMYPDFDLSNLCMVYLLGVAWISSYYSWKEAILASVLSVSAFDFIFVPPRFSFNVSDSQYLITFFVMLIISILISSLSLRNRTQTLLLTERERRTTSLYGLSRKLLSAASIHDVLNVVSQDLQSLFKCPASLLLLSEDFTKDTSKHTVVTPFNNANEEGVAKWAAEHKSAAGLGTDTLPGAKGHYAPIVSLNRTIAVLGLAPNARLDYDQSSLLDAVINQLTLALERILFGIASNKSELRAESERLRSTLLSSISHDLRTPLAVITGAASALAERKNISEENRNELSHTIWDESQRLTRIVRNVLDLTSIETQSVKLRKEWHSFEELVGSAISRTNHLLKGRQLNLDVPNDLPLLEVDGILIEQLLVNILENVAKHTPVNAKVSLKASFDKDTFSISISDSGPGVTPGEEELIFKKLYRGGSTKSQGFGLGLTICRAIMLAHEGSITAQNLSGGGAAFIINLPQPNKPPEVLY